MKREQYYWLLQGLAWSCLALFFAVVNKLEVTYMQLTWPVAGKRAQAAPAKGATLRFPLAA